VFFFFLIFCQGFNVKSSSLGGLAIIHPQEEMSQIGVELRHQSKIFLESCLVLALPKRNSLSKYTSTCDFFPLKYGHFLKLFYQKKSFVQFTLDFNFFNFLVTVPKKYMPKRKTLFGKIQNKSGHYICGKI
jgi:hypothetical protein